MVDPVTTFTFPKILRGHGIIWNESSPIAEETDLGDKFEVVGKHCGGILNQVPMRYSGFEPDGVLSTAVNCNWYDYWITGNCQQVPTTFIEIKFKFDALGSRDLSQGRLMVEWLAANSGPMIAKGYFPSLIYITTADTVIPQSLRTLATQQFVRMAQYVIAYDDQSGTFSSMPVIPLNTIQPPPGMPMVPHMFSATLPNIVPIGVMHMSLIGTRKAP